MTGKDREENLYRRLFVAAMDLNQVQHQANHLLKKGWHRHPWDKGRYSVYLQQAAFTTALVAAYGRVFTKSEGWPDIPARLIPYDAAEKELHGRLMEMRHSIYAHSDSKSFSIRLLPKGPIRSIDRLPSLRLSKEDTELVVSMTKNSSSGSNIAATSCSKASAMVEKSKAATSPDATM